MAALFFRNGGRGLVALLPGGNLLRHADDCKPGLWRVEANLGINFRAFLGYPEPPHCSAVVDDFGTLVKVPA